MQSEPVTYPKTHALQLWLRLDGWFAGPSKRFKFQTLTSYTKPVILYLLGRLGEAVLRPDGEAKVQITVGYKRVLERWAGRAGGGLGTRWGRRRRRRW